MNEDEQQQRDCATILWVEYDRVMASVEMELVVALFADSGDERKRHQPLRSQHLSNTVC